MEVSPLPALANGYVKFGCFDNLSKMNDAIMALWSKVLAAVSGSRLFLKGSEPRAKYLATYHQVDIELDPFPFTGATTCAEGLWMGVPLLTLSGKNSLSRQGVGILMNAVLPKWIADSTGGYVDYAVSHAANLQRLAALRSILRQQVLTSLLFDGARFARYFERAIWDVVRMARETTRLKDI